MTAACPFTGRVDDHFDGKTSVSEEAALRRHLLEGCSACHRRYTRLSMLERVSPSATRAQVRLGRGLGFGRRRAPRWWIALPALVAACALVLVLRPSPPTEFQARGPASPSAAGIRIFRLRPGASAEPANDRFKASDELAFAYRDAVGKPRHLYICGVDEHGHVFWFAPAWTRAGQQPAAPITVTDGKFHEIEDAVRHQYDGRQLDLHALFCEESHRLEELERALTPPPSAGPAPIPRCTDVLERYQVER